LQKNSAKFNLWAKATFDRLSLKLDGHPSILVFDPNNQTYREEIINPDNFFMKLAIAAAEGSTCMRGVKKDNHSNYKKDSENKFINQTRKMGCVIVKDNKLLSYGTNIQFNGSPLCEELGCLREELNIRSGDQLEKCRTDHAEGIAITKLAVTELSYSTKNATMYINAEPCNICAKKISDAQISRIVIIKNKYPNNGLRDYLNKKIIVDHIEL
jgi:dCMP deaminase